MTSIRAPRSVNSATMLCERFADLEGQISYHEHKRNATIAQANADADCNIEPLLAERNAIAARIEAWWPTAAAKLTEGQRKSIELGGCIIGTRMGRESLGIRGDEAKVLAKLEQADWARGLVRTRVSIDKTAVFKALGGEHADALKSMGFRKQPASETFYMQRAEQEGTVT